MPSLRSVVTQATRGGRCVVSRRSFCSETKKAEEIRFDPLLGPMTPLIQIFVGFVIGYITISPIAAEFRDEFKKGKYP